MKKSRFNKNEIKHFTKLLKLEKKSSQKELKSLDNLIKDQNEYIKRSDMSFGSDASKIRNIEMLKNMRRRTKGKLKLCNKALEKITAGTYGICDRTGKKISKQRLMAMPEANTSVPKIK